MVVDVGCERRRSALPDEDVSAFGQLVAADAHDGGHREDGAAIAGDAGLRRGRRRMPSLELVTMSIDIVSTLASP
jgi:hypothetical protein